MSGAFLGAAWNWVFPLVTAIASCFFAWPQFPTTWHTVYGALRAPGVLYYPDGTPDLSITLAALIFITGTTLYMRGYLAPGRTITLPHRISVPRTTRISARQGWNRVSLWTAMSSLWFLVVAFNAVEDRSGLIGSPLALAHTFIDGWFFKGSICMAIGVVIGQTRWRTGVAIWETLSTRSKTELTWISVLLSLRAIVVPLLIAAITASISNLLFFGSHGVKLPGFSTQTVHSALIMVGGIVFFSACGVCGTIIGRSFSRLWVTPAVFLLSTGLFISAATVLVQHTAPPTDHRDELSTCIHVEALNRELCTTATNTPYLPATVATLSEVYQDAPLKDYLPGRLYVVDNASAHSDKPMAKIGLYGQRAFTVPSRLTRQSVIQDLTTTLLSSCRDEAWHKALFAIAQPEDNGSRPTQEQLNQLRACLEQLSER